MIGTEHLDVRAVRIHRYAEAGIGLARARLTHVIPLDVQVPGIDSQASTRLIKANEATRGIKLVTLSTLGMVGDRERMIIAGCDGYVTKPIDYREMLKCSMKWQRPNRHMRHLRQIGRHWLAPIISLLSHRRCGRARCRRNNGP